MNLNVAALAAAARSTSVAFMFVLDRVQWSWTIRALKWLEVSGQRAEPNCAKTLRSGSVLD